jgi:hypothetical protein
MVRADEDERRRDEHDTNDRDVHAQIAGPPGANAGDHLAVAGARSFLVVSGADTLFVMAQC